MRQEIINGYHSSLSELYDGFDPFARKMEKQNHRITFDWINRE
jgi:hypothetical protein